MSEYEFPFYNNIHLYATPTKDCHAVPVRYLKSYVDSKLSNCSVTITTGDGLTYDASTKKISLNDSYFTTHYVTQSDFTAFVSNTSNNSNFALLKQQLDTIYKAKDSSGSSEDLSSYALKSELDELSTLFEEVTATVSNLESAVGVESDGSVNEDLSSFYIKSVLDSQLADLQTQISNTSSLATSTRTSLNNFKSDTTFNFASRTQFVSLRTEFNTFKEDVETNYVTTDDLDTTLGTCLTVSTLNDRIINEIKPDELETTQLNTIPSTPAVYHYIDGLIVYSDIDDEDDDKIISVSSLKSYTDGKYALASHTHNGSDINGLTEYIQTALSDSSFIPSVSTAIANNIAVFTENGELADSGVTKDSFASRNHSHTFEDLAGIGTVCHYDAGTGPGKVPVINSSGKLDTSIIDLTGYILKNNDVTVGNVVIFDEDGGLLDSNVAIGNQSNNIPVINSDGLLSSNIIPPQTIRQKETAVTNQQIDVVDNCSCYHISLVSSGGENESATIDITLQNPSQYVSGTVVTFELRITMPSNVINLIFSSGGNSDKIKWLNNSTPVVSVSDVSYIFVFRTYDLGNSWVGNLQGWF